jgi:hypothetical protein
MPVWIPAPAAPARHPFIDADFIGGEDEHRG